MRLTSEYVSNTSLEKAQRESDDDSLDSKRSGATGIDGESNDGMVKRRTAQMKKIFGSAVKKTMLKAKTIGRHNKEDPKEEVCIRIVRSWVDDLRSPKDLCTCLEKRLAFTVAIRYLTPTIMLLAKSFGVLLCLQVVDEASTSTGEHYIKIKASSSHKGPYEFDCVQLVQVCTMFFIQGCRYYVFSRFPRNFRGLYWKIPLKSIFVLLKVHPCGFTENIQTLVGRSNMDRMPSLLTCPTCPFSYWKVPFWSHSKRFSRIWVVSTWVQCGVWNSLRVGDFSQLLVRTEFFGYGLSGVPTLIFRWAVSPLATWGVISKWICGVIGIADSLVIEWDPNKV